MNKKSHPPEPIHIRGTARGEEMVIQKGREAGRDRPAHQRSARDSTGINARDREPIDPAMPELPPA